MRLEGERVVVVDIDDTLVMYDLSDFPELKTIDVVNEGHGITLGVNQKNVNTVIKFAKLGYKVIFWSRSGMDWAIKIAEALEIKRYVNLFMTKPLYYIDDKSADAWMDRVYRSPKDEYKA